MPARLTFFAIVVFWLTMNGLLWRAEFGSHGGETPVLAGMTVLVSTHQLSIAEERCDRIGIINGGKLIAVGSREELRQQSGAAGELEEIFLALTAAANHAA
jgi:ABC-type sulfate/molybdate transport systems ATPase subunit